MAETITEKEFEHAADAALVELARALDAAARDFEADLQNGILTIEFGDGVKYIVNSHRAARQIWMAAERNAWHFDLDRASGAWRAQKSGDELWGALERVIAKKIGGAFSLKKA